MKRTTGALVFPKNQSMVRGLRVAGKKVEQGEKQVKSNLGNFEIFPND